MNYIPAVDVAIIGAGAAGLLHALAYRAYGARIGWVYDVDLTRASQLAEAVGGVACTSLDAIGDADVVSVASPPVAHVAQAVRFACPGRIVVVEKPVGISSAEIVALLALPGCVPIVQWREGRGIRAIRRAIGEGYFGPTPSVTMDLTLARDETYFATRSSRASWGAGALLSVGIHALDAACFALGSSVTRVAVERGGDDLETTGAALLRFGASIGTLRVTFDGGPDRVRLAFAGAGVTAVIDGGEADPTACDVHWSATRAEVESALRELESGTAGARSAPLIVPYLGRVVAAARGASSELPSILDLAATHAALM